MFDRKSTLQTSPNTTTVEHEVDAQIAAVFKQALVVAIQAKTVKNLWLFV
jgi:hypothetical protein